MESVALIPDQSHIFDGAKVWELHATHGLPIELSIPLLSTWGKVPSWDRLLSAAAKDGANIERLILRLKEVVADSYSDKSMVDDICRRLPVLYEWMKKHKLL